MALFDPRDRIDYFSLVVRIMKFGKRMGMIEFQALCKSCYFKWCFHIAA